MYIYLDTPVLNIEFHYNFPQIAGQIAKNRRQKLGVVKTI